MSAHAILRRTAMAMLVCCLVGCEARTPYRMQFIDASSGQPLSGVRIELVEDGYHFNNRFLSVKRITEISVTGADPTVSLNLVYEWKNSLTVQCRGYRTALIHSYHYPGPNSWYIEYADKENFQGKWNWSASRVVTIPPETVFRVLMYRVGQAIPSDE